MMALEASKAAKTKHNTVFGYSSALQVLIPFLIEATQLPMQAKAKPQRVKSLGSVPESKNTPVEIESKAPRVANIEKRGKKRILK